MGIGRGVFVRACRRCCLPAHLFGVGSVIAAAIMHLFAVCRPCRRPLIRRGHAHPLGRFRLAFGELPGYCLGVVRVLTIFKRLTLWCQQKEESMKLLQPQGSAAASGTAGGITVSRNRFGFYQRNKSIPVNPSTALQNAVRSAFAELAARWSQLTQAEREAWQVYSNAVPRSDVFGQPITLDGRQMYMACNTLRKQAGLTIVDAGPTTLTLPELSLPVPTITAGDAISLGFTGTDGWATEVGGALLFYASPPKSPQTNYCRGPYRYAGKVAGAATAPTSPATLTAPFVYTEGQRVYWKAVALLADGRMSSPSYGNVFCGA